MKSIFRLILILNFLLVINNLLLCQEPQQDTSGVFNKVKRFTEKDNFFSKLLRNIFVFEDESFDTGEEVTRNYNKFSGKIIRKINVNVLDVFGASVNHPNRQPNSWLQKTGNAIHYETRDWLIKNKLLFDKGEQLYPFEVSESERLIRQSNYVYDVRISVRPATKDSVDVNVIVQDLWSITGNANYSPSDKSGYLTLRDLNFLGFGTELSSTVRFGNIYPQKWNWDGTIIMNNIQRTYFTGQVYHYSFGKDINYGISVNRDFISPVINWAGGAGLNWINSYPLFLTDSSFFTQNLAFNQQDLWIGYAFDFLPFKVGRINYNRLNIALRSISTLYTNKPEQDTLGIFQNNILYLGRIGYSYRQFYKDRYIFGLGRTEDIPAGYLFELILGIENGELRKRPYYGIRAGLSSFGESGYIYGGFQTGAYRNGTGWKSGIISADIFYFTKLLSLGNLKWRHFFWNRYSFRYDPITQGQLLSINEGNGIRGYAVDLLGNKKYVLNYENNIFIPLNILGFQLAFVTFADFGLLASKNQDLFNSKLYQGYGIGFRIRNEHLIFPPIQFVLGIYPGRKSPGQTEFTFYHQNPSFYQFNNFQFTKPSVIEF